MTPLSYKGLQQDDNEFYPISVFDFRIVQNNLLLNKGLQLDDISPVMSFINQSGCFISKMRNFIHIGTRKCKKITRGYFWQIASNQNLQKWPKQINIQPKQRNLAKSCHTRGPTFIKIRRDFDPIRGQRREVKTVDLLGRGGGGQVVSVLTFNSDDSSLNPADVYSFFPVKFVFEKNEKIYKKG